MCATLNFLPDGGAHLPSHRLEALAIIRAGWLLMIYAICGALELGAARAAEIFLALTMAEIYDTLVR